MLIFEFNYKLHLNMNTLLIIGIIGLIIGFIIQYWIYRRKFYRRNSSGVEGFSSFEKSVFTRLFEQILKWLSYLFIIIGILYLWRSCRTSNEDSPVKNQQIIKK